MSPQHSKLAVFLGAVLLLACAPPQKPVQHAAHEVLVSRDAPPKDPSSPPHLGSSSAPVTVVALLAFDDPESGTVLALLRRLQAQHGRDKLRLALMVRPRDLEAASAENLALQLWLRRGDAAYFDFASALYDNGARDFGDRLGTALRVSRQHAAKDKPDHTDSQDKSLPVLESEALALLDDDDIVPPALSINGIRFLGRPTPSELDQLLNQEFEASQALAQQGVAAEALYPERVAANADKVLWAGESTGGGSSEPTGESPVQAEPPGGSGGDDSNASAPDQITARHILIAYVGARRARKTVSRSKAQAQKLAREVADKIKQGQLSFEQAVERYSDEPNTSNGGRLGSFSRHHMVKPFSDAAFALSVGEVSSVVETNFGFHIIWREE